MDKLLICRICLAKDIKMFLITDTRLQEIYETLTIKPFETQDNRPQQVCYICCAKLQNCYNLKKHCLRGEELLTQMYGKDPTPADLGDLERTRLNVTTVSHLDINHTECTEIDKHINPNAAEVFSDVEVKLETIEDDHDPEEQRNSEDTTHSNPNMNTEVKIEEIDENAYKEPIFDETVTKKVYNDEITNKRTVLKNKEHKSINKSSLDISNNKNPLNKQFKCDTCQKYFANGIQLDVHTCTHTGYQRKSTLRNHLPTHTVENPFQCDMCNERFDRKSTLTSHMHSLHNIEKVYQCYICKKCFSSKTSLSCHFPTHTGEKPFECHVCNKCFSTNFNLRKHIRTHSGEKHFQCKICRKGFSQKFNLQRHLHTHTGAKPYDCDVCNKCFSAKSDMKTHRRTHTGEKPYQCHVCTKRLSSKKNLRRHSLIHTGEKPYQCDVCKKWFSSKSDLKSHIRSHTSHTRTGDKPYQCEICKKLFSVKSSLKCHIRNHSTVQI